MSFIRFGAIQEYRLMNNAIEAGVEKKDFDARMPLENTIDKITERRNQVKDEFKVIECEQCGLEAPLSWDKLSIGAMARKLDDARYKALYLGSYAMPNLHIHATYMSAVYLENLGPQDKATAQKLEAYANVGNASAIMLLVLNEQNKMFNLGLDRELETAEKAIVEEWFSRKKPEQNDGDR